ncbi:hypothetical protein ABER99_21565 [Paenibacillus glucanolyticus]|jgi:hypothetical protein|uniref:Lipoprotein n=1 Tax=Paenibacillus glucanolyticus TaxID=59843 RepID=A0A163GTV7_9BACL|nr:hypothetical protein [Paenibacillus glucanolyticus]KZS45147.1 hypothetical protein AWU65_03960 [Paenibacillus glucanolyticus]OMF64424.1 hypothetical protein BK142_31905 [Paenibacillus glucanolyticus]
MSLKRIISASVITCTSLSILSGCFLEEPSIAQQEINKQTEQKMQQAAQLATQVEVPQMDASLERQNIVDRIKAFNDPSKLMWLYVISEGNIIDRVPVRGKVTNGNKRLTSTETFSKAYQGGYNNDVIVEAPDEVGVFGNAGDFIFWFDPSGEIYQTNGTYYIKPHPYKYTTAGITTDIDEQEVAKIPEYKKQIQKHLSSLKKAHKGNAVKNKIEVERTDNFESEPLVSN